jgi:hypothetical protein
MESINSSFLGDLAFKGTILFNIKFVTFYDYRSLMILIY